MARGVERRHLFAAAAAAAVAVTVVVLHRGGSPAADCSTTVNAGGPVPTTGLAVPTTGLAVPAKKAIAQSLVASAENSTLTPQYAYLEDIGDGRGDTGGIVGFTTANGDLLDVVRLYTKAAPGNRLTKYIQALEDDCGSDSRAGLGDAFVADWKAVADDPRFRAAQDRVNDAEYFDPAVAQAQADGLSILGQFVYYDAYVMHGPGDDSESFGGIRAAAVKQAEPPAQGGDETAYLQAFFTAREAVMRHEEAHTDTSRIETAQRVFLTAGNVDLNLPLHWHVYRQPFDLP